MISLRTKSFLSDAVAENLDTLRLGDKSDAVLINAV
jgi:hypothetical protein